MTVTRSRSLSQSLVDGGTDGKYFKRRPNTASTPGNDAVTLGERSSLHPDWNYGLLTQEAPSKVMPDGTRS